MEGSSAFVYFRYTMFIKRNYTSEPRALLPSWIPRCWWLLKETRVTLYIIIIITVVVIVVIAVVLMISLFMSPARRRSLPRAVILIYSHMAVRHCRAGLAHLLRCDATPNAAHEDDYYDYSHLAPRPISRGGEDGCGNDCFIY